MEDPILTLPAPIPDKEKKLILFIYLFLLINFKFYFLSFLCVSKGFTKAFETPKRSVKIKI